MKAQDLKNSILQLAIQGKLVEQRTEEGTAKELLEKIAAEKKQLIQEGKIKKQKDLPTINEDEFPFDIPESWEWMRLGDVGSWSAGATPSRSNPKFYGGDIPWLKTGDLNDSYIAEVPEFISEEALKKTSVRLNPIGSVLMAMYGATIGKLGILDIEATTNQACCACIPYSIIYNKYLFYFLMGQRRVYIKMGAGGAQPNISKEKIVNSIVPLPPLEEQKRIVSKIEELMPYVEKYDVAYSEVEKLNKKFPEDMQKSILQYAIQGKLVAQRKEDGTAEELYQQIQKENQKLIEEGTIKKTKALPEITEDEIPFDIPENWKWVRLGKLCNYGQCNSIPAKSIPKDAWLLDLEDIEKDSGRVLNKKRMYDVKSTSSKHVFNAGDVLYSKLRPYLNKVVIADEDGYSTSEILPLDFGTSVYNRYAQIVMMSPYFINYTVKCSYGVKMPRLGTTDGQLAVFPLPPLKEQKRIVDKVHELIPYAKQLANKINLPTQGAF